MRIEIENLLEGLRADRIPLNDAPHGQPSRHDTRRAALIAACTAELEKPEITPAVAKAAKAAKAAAEELKRRGGMYSENRTASRLTVKLQAAEESLYYYLWKANH